MARAFLMREVKAIAQDLKEIGDALQHECDRVVDTARENENNPDRPPVACSVLRPLTDWKSLLEFESARLNTLLEHIAKLDIV